MQFEMEIGFTKIERHKIIKFVMIIKVLMTYFEWIMVNIKSQWNSDFIGYLQNDLQF